MRYWAWGGKCQSRVSKPSGPAGRATPLRSKRNVLCSSFRRFFSAFWSARIWSVFCWAAAAMASLASSISTRTGSRCFSV